MDVRRHVITWVQLILCLGHICYVSLNHVNGRRTATRHHHEKRSATHPRGARNVMGDIASKLLEHAGEHITKHVKRAVRSTLNKGLPLSGSTADGLVSAPNRQGFVEAPPIGPMETLSIDIKGHAQTYKNFSKPSDKAELDGKGLNYRDFVTDNLSPDSRSNEGLTDTDEGSSGTLQAAQNATPFMAVNTETKPMKPRKKKKIKILGKDNPANKTLGRRKKRKRNRNRYKVYSEFTSNATSSSGLGVNVTSGNNTQRQGVVADQTPIFTMGHNSVSELPHPVKVEDKMPVHAGDIGIDHDVPQESIKEGHEQGPLLPEHEQGPKLPGNEKGPALLEDEKGPLPSEKIHPTNFTSHVEESVETPPEIKLDKEGHGCPTCIGPNGPGVPVLMEQEGSMHCAPCPGHKVAAAEKHPVKIDEDWDAMRNLTKEQHPDGELNHGHIEKDQHEPEHIHAEVTVETVPPLAEGITNLPVISGLQHAEFEKMGVDINHELLGVIEGNNAKVATLWNEVKSVESRLGNMESVMEVIEKAVHRIETKMDSLSHPVYPTPPLAPPLNDYGNPRPIETFPHAPLSHSPVLKQFFIPLQSPVSPDAPKELNAGLPWPVSKFLTFLVQELMREKSTLQFEPGMPPGTASGLASGLASQGLTNVLPPGLSSAVSGLANVAHTPHVPLPQPDLPYPPKEHDIDRLEYEIGKLPLIKKKGQKTYHPDIEEPSICHCENGGQCNGRSECDCPIRYTGPRCERPVPRSPLLDSIINDMPPETLRQVMGARQTGLITLPMMLVDKEDAEPTEQRVNAEGNENKLVNIISQYLGHELMQKFVKRQKVNMRRYVKYSADKDKKRK